MPDLAPRHGRRLQRPRTRGYQTPEGVIYAGRPSLFGNPFRSDRFGHVRSIRLHRAWLEGRLSALALERMGFCPAEIDTLTRRRGRVLDALPRIAGRDLQCWCPLSSRWCHADTLLAMIPATSH